MREIIFSEYRTKKIATDVAFSLYSGEDIDEESTLNRHLTVFNILMQLPPYRLKFSKSVYFLGYEHHNHRVIELVGVEDYRVIKKIVLCVFKDEEKSLVEVCVENERILPFLITAMGKPASVVSEAKRFHCTVYGISPKFTPAINAIPIGMRENMMLRVEMCISYTDENLLPVRFIEYFKNI
jgi:hypothetical protein